MRQKMLRAFRVIAVLNGICLGLSTSPACANWVAAPPGGHRSAIDFGAGTPFSPSTWTPAHNAHIPGIATGIGLAKHGLTLDLSSTNPTIVLAPQMIGWRHVTVNVGGTQTVFQKGETVTGAEFVAILQAMSRAGQTLQLNAGGAAIGGRFALNGLVSPRITGLTIPQNVTALDNSGWQPLLGMPYGDLTNSGTIYMYSSNPYIHTGLLFAQNITNTVGGTISSIVPANMTSMLHSIIPSFNMILAAVNNINNSGLIASSGHLTLATAYGSINNALPSGVTGPNPAIMSMDSMRILPGNNGTITNAGLITSVNGNIDMVSPVVTTPMNLVGTGGVMQAFNGAINLREKYYQGYTLWGTATTNITGGEYDAPQGLNIYASTGTITGTFSAPIFSANSNASTNLTDTSSGNVTLTNSTASDFTLNTSGSTMLNSITATNGGIGVTAATGLLQTAPGSSLLANNGGVTLQNLDTTNGSIQLGFASNIHTMGTGGPVNVVIGTVPSTPTAGAQPGNIYASTFNGGQIFYGSTGITAQAPTNNLTADSENIVFETNGAQASAITLNGLVNIVADPSPAAPAVAVPVTSVSAQTAIVPATQTFSGDVATASSLAIASNSTAPAALTLPALTSTTVTATDAVRNALPSSAAEQKGVQKGDDGMVDAVVIGDNSLVSLLNYRAGEPLHGYIAGGHMQPVSVSTGNSLFFPTEDTVVHTPLADLRIAAKSLVLLMVSDKAVSVFNVDDNARDSVVVQIDGRKTTLAPGQHLTVASNSMGYFGLVNPLVHVGHRNLKQVKLDNGAVAFSSDFSILSLIESTKPLRRLVAYHEPQSKKIADHMLKTAACIQQMSKAHGPYQQIGAPQLAAWQQ